MLYIELPRAVFESQRAKEDLLVYRGQEYQRAIQLYWRKFRKYPQTIEDLEKSSGQRFLRKRFVDPMTGKDEWRIVNIVNGAYTNSKVIKPPAQGQQTLGSSISAEANQTAQDPNDPALKKRASDTSAADIGGQSGQAGQNPAVPGDPNAPPSALPPNSVPPPPNPGQYFTGGVGGVGGSAPAYSGGVGSSTYPTTGANSQTGGQIGTPIAGAPTVPGQLNNQPGQRQLTPEQISPALDVIQKLLTTPRQPPPGIFNNSQGSTAAAAQGAFPISGPAAGAFGSGGQGGAIGLTGIAGFASKKEGKGIKIINERERIEEWEFIYDPAKDKGGRPNANAQTQQPGQPGQLGQQGQQGIGGLGGGFGTGFGGQQQGGRQQGGQPGGFGQGGGFGGQQPRIGQQPGGGAFPIRRQ